MIAATPLAVRSAATSYTRTTPSHDEAAKRLLVGDQRTQEMVSVAVASLATALSLARMASALALAALEYKALLDLLLKDILAGENEKQDEKLLSEKKN